MNTIGADVQPVQNLRVLNRVASLVEGDAARAASVKAEWGRWAIENGFVGVEADLRETAGRYCVGDAITLADVFLVPQVYNAARFKVDMARFPTIARVAATLAEVPEFAAAHPDRQPDFDPAAK